MIPKISDQQDVQARQWVGGASSRGTSHQDSRFLKPLIEPVASEPQICLKIPKYGFQPAVVFIDRNPVQATISSQAEISGRLKS